MLIFYGKELLVLHPTPKLEDHHLSAVCDCGRLYLQLPSMSEGAPV